MEQADFKWKLNQIDWELETKERAALLLENSFTLASKLENSNKLYLEKNLFCDRCYFCTSDKFLRVFFIFMYMI